MGKSDTPRVGSLTGLRFFAALGVAFAHLPYLHTDETISLTLRRICMEGGVGVPFFFTLSGFVLAMAYARRLSSLSWSGCRSYYLSRFARIWPVHVLTLGLAFWLPVSPQAGSFSTAMANLFLVHSWIPDLEYVQSYNSVTWTLSIEFFFYLMFPILIVALNRGRNRSSAVLTLAAVVVWMMELVWVMGVKQSCNGVTALYMSNICPMVRIGEFLAGMFLGFAYLNRREMVNDAGNSRSYVRWSILELMSIGILLIMMMHAHRVNPLYRFNVYYVPALMLIVTVFAREKGILSCVMKSRIMLYLGEMSFALFMIHPFLFIHVGDRVGAEWGVVARAALSLGFAVLAAAIVHRLVESPLRIAISQWYDLATRVRRRTWGSEPGAVLAVRLASLSQGESADTTAVPFNREGYAPAGTPAPVASSSPD